MSKTLAAVLFSCLLAACQAPAAPPATVFHAEEYGVAADGVSDDGPAIVRLLEAACASGRATVRFPENREIYVASSPSRYVFKLEGMKDLEIDGNGCTFLLSPDVRFLFLSKCRNFTLRRLNVDFRPLPFVDGVVTAVDAAAHCLEVRVPEEDRARIIGGPTKQDGEQAFFGMLWYEGAYSTVSRHYWVDSMQAGSASDTVRVVGPAQFREFGDIVPGKWRISLPVPGIAHRYGPGACFRVRDNDTVTMEDVELWSAPWMGFEVARNTGKVTFHRVNIRPKPESGRLMSLWRDGFHVKGNSASLLWEACEVGGMNDDAFNISTHSSEVDLVHSPTRIEVHQRFPLIYMPWQAGDHLVAVDEPSRRILGTAAISKVETGPQPPDIDGHPAAPRTTIELATPIEGIARGAIVWMPESSNPDTTLRRCRINMSCRMQSPMTLEDCQVTALLWFYSEPIEGPFPAGVTVRNCVLRRGRGNPTQVVLVAGAPEPGAKAANAADPPRAIHDVVFEGNQVYGAFTVEGVDGLVLKNNTFPEHGAALTLRKNYHVTSSGNEAEGKPVLTEALP